MPGDLKLCDGCSYDFYNGHNDIGVERCWSLASASVVLRWRQHWWTPGNRSGAFVQVQTNSCHVASGRYLHLEKLPDFAVNPVYLKK